MTREVFVVEEGGRSVLSKNSDASGFLLWKKVVDCYRTGNNGSLSFRAKFIFCFFFLTILLLFHPIGLFVITCLT